MSYMYGISCVPFYLRKTACQKYFFQILSQKNAQFVNLKKPDLDLIRRIHPECGFYGFMIRFWICAKNAKSVIRIKVFSKNAPLVEFDLDFEIWISDFAIERKIRKRIAPPRTPSSR